MSGPHDQTAAAARPRSRFDLSGEAQATLLRDARRFKGESLWQDAWRRLRRNRGAWWSLVFLALFAGSSLLAPLLPLASPMALDPQKEPQPPRLPWEASPRLAANAPPGKQFAFGTAATRALGAFADDGWRHRTFVDVDVEAPWSEGGPPPNGLALTEAVRAASGRRPVLYARAGDRPGTVRVRAAVPLREDDRERTEYRAAPTPPLGTVTATGTGTGTGSGAGPDAGASTAPVTLLETAAGDLFVRIDGALDPARWTSWTARATESGLELVYTLGDEAAGDDADEADALLYRRWFVPAPGLADATVRGLQVGDRPLAVSGPSADGGRAEAGDPRPRPEPAGFPDDLGLAGLEGRPDGARIALDDLARLERVGEDGEREALLRRHTLLARHEEARAHDDLGRRVARELDAAAVPHLDVEVAHVAGIWELNPLDRALVRLRGAVFGTWQLGPLLGTDNKGRDLLSRIVWGSRISIQVSLVATLCSLVIGVTYGAFAGLMGGRVDNLMMRIVDVLYSVPFIFVVIFLITLINEYRTELAEVGIGYMTVFYLVVGAIYWLTMARVVRGQVLSLKHQEFVEAARVLGASTPRILFVHLVPNVLSVVIVYLTLTIPAVMLFEAFLSFLGLGVEPPMVSWGLLAVDGTEAISAVKVFWWVVTFPAVAMGSTLLALNVLGDGLRDALDPKLRGKD